MIKVYFETNVHAELVAIFNDEEAYHACFYALDLLREQQGYDIITESVEDDIELNDLDYENR